MNQQTILIAEDDALLRNALTDKLTREGFTVQIAHDGRECVEKALTVHPDLILLDVLMPKMGGQEALKELRSDAWGAHVKVILLTNVTDLEEHAEEGVPYADGYLIKSETNIGDVVKKIQEQLPVLELTQRPVARTDLPEYRCTCGKLLFKGALLFSTVEIKCKRCSALQRIDTAGTELLG